MRPRRLLFACLVLGAAELAHGQLPSTPTLVVPSQAERIEVDLVVRDRQGALIRDLDPAEVEVRENGVRQEIESFAFVAGGARGGLAASPTFLALAFDRLGPATRRLAGEAALDLLSRELPPASEMGVFSVDGRLAVVQPFSADRPALRRALEGASSLAPTSLVSQRQREMTRNAYHGLGEGFGQAHVAPAEQKGAPECREREEVTTRLTEMLESRLVEGFESVDRDRRGSGTVHALLALVGALEALPGRKAVLLFSEGLTFPSDEEGTYRALIAAAHRSRVRLYTADAEGLRVASPADEMRRAADALRTRLRSSSDGGRLTEDSPLVLLERNHETLRVAAEGTLARLADETGGFAIRGTNDLSAGLARVQEELLGHYVLSYAPKDRRFDGRFRRIAVKVRRPHGRVQARKGYFALKAPLPDPVLPYEVAALARLESGDSPGAFPVLLRALQFPEEPGLARVSILVEVAPRRDLAIVVLVRDAARRVVRRLSERYEPSERLDRPGGSEPVLFHREVRLPTGDYRLEAVAWDARAREAGLAATELSLPRADPGQLRASSLVLVSRAEKVEERGDEAPLALQLRDVLLHPNVGRPVKREPGRALGFFVRAWPAAGRPGVDARVQLVRGERTVAAAPPVRLQPEGDGRVQLVSTLPVESLLPGAYELRVTLTDGRDAETRTAALAVVP